MNLGKRWDRPWAVIQSIAGLKQRLTTINTKQGIWRKFTQAHGRTCKGTQKGPNHPAAPNSEPEVPL